MVINVGTQGNCFVLDVVGLVRENIDDDLTVSRDWASYQDSGFFMNRAFMRLISDSVKSQAGTSARSVRLYRRGSRCKMTKEMAIKHHLRRESATPSLGKDLTLI